MDEVSQGLFVLGTPLADLTVDQTVARGVQGGLVLAPSGPGLCDLARDPDYREALLESDLNLTDSGFVLMVRALRGHGLAARTSGFRYLRELLREPSVREPGATYWVMPSRESMLRNLEWLEAEGHGVTEDDCYVAPLYPRRGPVEDPDLLAILERRRPKHVFVCVGSGVQEKLGLYLKRLLPYRPGIHCVGAAIAFLSGDQARIPLWADRLALGWLVRCIRDPKVFVPRYLRAFRLASLILRYDENPPAARRGLEVKAVVFGGAGYIGRHVKNLTARFDDVVLVDHRRPTPPDVRDADVREPIPPSVAGDPPPDWIVLLAAVHREPGHEPHEYFETNLAGARNVAAYADAVGCRKIFFFSSSSVYGVTERATDERTTTCPTDGLPLHPLPDAHVSRPERIRTRAGDAEGVADMLGPQDSTRSSTRPSSTHWML